MKENSSDDPTNDGIENDNNIDRDPIFYYSREHRLSRASQTVRDFNEGEPTRPGLTKALFGTRGNIFLFGSILMICAMLVLTSRFSGGERRIKLGGNTVAITISREEGAFILDMVKNAPKNGEAYTGDVWFAVSPVMPKSKEGVQPEVFTDYATFFPLEYEVFRFPLPFVNIAESSSDAFFIILMAGNEQKTLRINARLNK